MVVRSINKRGRCMLACIFVLMGTCCCQACTKKHAIQRNVQGCVQLQNLNEHQRSLKQGGSITHHLAPCMHACMGQVRMEQSSKPLPLPAHRRASISVGTPMQPMTKPMSCALWRALAAHQMHDSQRQGTQVGHMGGAAWHGHHFTSACQ